MWGASLRGQHLHQLMRIQQYQVHLACDSVVSTHLCGVCVWYPSLWCMRVVCMLLWCVVCMWQDAHLSVVHQCVVCWSLWCVHDARE